MKPCKYCQGVGTQGIGQDYCDCSECGGSGIANNDFALTLFACAMVFVVCLVIVVKEFFK